MVVLSTKKALKGGLVGQKDLKTNSYLFLCLLLSLLKTVCRFSPTTIKNMIIIFAFFVLALVLASRGC